MAVSFDLPSEIEHSLRRSLGDLDAAAKEAALVELYRQGKITHRQLCESLGLTRLEAEALLKSHNVTEDLPTATEYEAALAHLRVTTTP